MTGPVRNSTEGMEKVGSSESEVNGQSVHPVLNTTQGSGVAAVQGHTKVLAIRPSPRICYEMFI